MKQNIIKTTKSISFIALSCVILDIGYLYGNENLTEPSQIDVDLSWTINQAHQNQNDDTEYNYQGYTPEFPSGYSDISGANQSSSFSCDSQIKQEQNSYYTCCDSKFPNFLYVRPEAGYAFGQYIALDQKFGFVKLFSEYVLHNQTSGAFFDLRGYRLENNKYAASGGCGFRKWYDDQEIILGINMYYDYRGVCRGNFNQIGFGLEGFKDCWELHFNGYFPLGKNHQLTSDKLYEFEGGYYARFKETTYALTGFELSVGYNWCLFDCLQLYIAPGYYYYTNSNKRYFQGAELAVDVIWNQYLQFNLNASCDYKFKANAQGTISLVLPFDFSFCSSDRFRPCVSPLFCRDVRRNDMIFTDERCCVEKNWSNCPY